MKIFGLALALIVAFGPVGAEVLTGHVVGVTDGDTITVLDAAKVQHKIRVAGIDAPEKKQAFGQVSKETCLYWFLTKRSTSSGQSLIGTNASWVK